MLPTVTPATSYSSCSTWRGATRLRMTSLTAVKLLAVDLDVDGEQVDDAVVAGEDGCEAAAPVVARQRREEADVAVVDAERRHGAAEQATQRAQDGAVAAEDEAEIGVAQRRLVDDRVAESVDGRVPGRLVGRHEQLEPEALAGRGQLRQRGPRGLRGDGREHGDAAQRLSHGRPRRRARPRPRRRPAPGAALRVAEVDEVLHVPLRSGMARVADAQHHGAAPLEPGADALEHVAVDGRIAHDAALADPFAAGLELRLDEHEAAVAGRAAILARAPGPPSGR